MSVALQRREALAHGNRVRLARAEVRRRIRNLPGMAGRALAVEVLRDPPEHCGGMEVFQLLVCVKGLGAARATSMLIGAGVVAQRKPIGELTVRQREVLVGMLGGGR